MCIRDSSGNRWTDALKAAALDELLGDGPVPPPGTPPTRIAAWWRGLDQSVRNRLTDTRPEFVGSLDGLPARDRDRANRLLLTRLLDRYERLPAPDHQLLDGLRAIRRRLAAGPGSGPGQVLLLGLSEAGRGRAVLCFGDPDRADHVAAYVPGFGTKLAAVAPTGRSGCARPPSRTAAGGAWPRWSGSATTRHPTTGSPPAASPSRTTPAPGPARRRT